MERAGLRLRSVQTGSTNHAGAHPEDVVNEKSIRLVGEVWHLHYQGESGDYPAKDNQALSWLAKLLAAPGRHLTVADLRGDPEGKLKADATARGERLTDTEGLRGIWTRLQGIDALSESTGGSATLEEERADLLRKVKEGEEGKQAQTSAGKAHHNTATQLRNLRKKLADKMPALAAHLDSTLDLAAPDFRYNPPASTPAWKT
jgi:hypothetical protein